MDLLLLSCRLVLTAIFGTAGIAKAIDRSGSRKALVDFGLPQAFVGSVAVLLPTLEIATSVLLVFRGSTPWGAAAALALLLFFAIVIAANLLRGRTPDCHCFGQLHSRPISWGLAARDLVFSAVAGAILWRGPGAALSTVVHAFTSAATTQPLPVAAISIATTGFMLQTLLLLALFNQHGRLLVRVGKLESAVRGAGASVLTPPADAGLPIGSPAPPFEFSSGGGFVPLETLLVDGKPLLLVFTDPDCGACGELLPDLERWDRQYSKFINFVIVSRHAAPHNGQPLSSNGFRNMAWQREREISESYRVSGIPAAVVVRPDATIGTWLTAGRPAIQGLIQHLLYMQVLGTSCGQKQLTSS